MYQTKVEHYLKCVELYLSLLSLTHVWKFSVPVRTILDDGIYEFFQTIDIFGNIEVEIEKESDNIISILKDEDKIGFLKIQRKKVLLCIEKLNITLDLDISNYSDSLQIIPAICKNI